MKKINTLSEDIFDALRSMKKDEESNVEVLSSYGSNVAKSLDRSLRERYSERQPYKLYVSEIGKKCHRALWYAHRVPSLTEELQPHSKFKFVYGDLIEETVLTMAELAGHTVEKRQEPVKWTLDNGWAVNGRIDAVIDGVLVDVKSASTYSFQKFVKGFTVDDDAFGYIEQLSTYNGIDAPLYDKQGIVAIDKQNGHIDFFPIPYNPTKEKAVAATEAIMLRHEPDRLSNAVEKATFGNSKLGVTCSYCAFKKACWRNANGGKGLAAAIYSQGPQFLTKVVKAPKVALRYDALTSTEELALAEALEKPYGE